MTRLSIAEEVPPDMTPHDAIRHTQALVREWAQELRDEEPIWPDDPNLSEELDQRADQLDNLLGQEFDQPEDGPLAVIGTLKALNFPESCSPRHKAKLEADEGSIWHRTGRWKAYIEGTGRADGTAAAIDERGLASVLEELEGQQQRLGRALAEFAAKKGAASPKVNAGMEEFSERLLDAASEVRRRLECVEQGETFWGAQMTAEAAYDLACIAWFVVAWSTYVIVNTGPPPSELLELRYAARAGGASAVAVIRPPVVPTATR